MRMCIVKFVGVCMKILTGFSLLNQRQTKTKKGLEMIIEASKGEKPTGQERILICLY